MATAEDGPQRMLGAFIRTQRQMANLSLRQLSALAKVSNPYLSQVERGLHEPSVRVLRSIADALNMSAQTLLEQAGLISHTASFGRTASSGDRDRHDITFGGGNLGNLGKLSDAGTKDNRTEGAIRADRSLTEMQRRAMLNVYQSYVEDNRTESRAHPPVGPKTTSLAGRLGDSTS